MSSMVQHDEVIDSGVTRLVPETLACDDVTTTSEVLESIILRQRQIYAKLHELIEGVNAMQLPVNAGILLKSTSTAALEISGDLQDTESKLAIFERRVNSRLDRLEHRNKH